MLGFAAIRLLPACGLYLPLGLGRLDYCLESEAGPTVQERDLAQLRIEHEQLDRALHDLRHQLAAAPDCPVPDEDTAPATEVAESPPLGGPDPDPDPETDAEGPAEPLSEPPRPVVEIETGNCPPPPAGEVILVLDASVSMDWALALDPDLERAFIRALESPDAETRSGQRRLSELDDRINATPGPRRFRVAQDALQRLIPSLPADVRIGFVQFNQCRRTSPGVWYDPHERPQLIQRVRRASTDFETALSEGLRIGAGMTSGGRSEDRPVNMIVLSDGQDSCGADPCAIARQLKRERPHLQITVVALSRLVRPLRCIAEATDGALIFPEDVDQIADSLRWGTGQVARPEGCE